MNFYRSLWNTFLLFLGGFFLVGGVLNLNNDKEAALFGFLVGIGFFLWRFIPEIFRRKKEKAEKLEAEATKELIQKEKEERMWTCKHCGASTRGKCCEYCDSPYEE